MSSNQNNEKNKVHSIARKINSRIFRHRNKVCVGFNVFIFFLVVFVWISAMIYSQKGRIYNPDIEIAACGITYDSDAFQTMLTNFRFGASFERHMDDINKCLVCYISAVNDPNYFNVPVGGVIFFSLLIIISLHIFELLINLIVTLAESATTERILAPLNEIAIRADELAKLDLSDERFNLETAYDEKYHLLEDKITQLNPEESLKITNSDRELAGIETAINNLLQRMRESNMQQARFVNDASHELRTPIAVIEGYANMLARWGREDTAVLDESITAIQNESAHMKYLVEQLLFLARGDSGKTVLHKELVSLTDMMREIYEESLMIDENHIYRFSAPENPVMYECDFTLLKQAVRILIDNAAKYTAEHDEISISVGITEDFKPYLQVQDTGIGMGESDVAHMFERFYRSDEARSYKGTGLGLSIAKWIVDKHHGHFEITSRTELGTRIRIVLE